MLRKWLIYRRLPWVRASDARDCGAAVFASIAAYYDHHLTIEEARELVHTDRDGTTLAGLRDGGRALGFDARPAQAIYEALAHIQLPAIVHLHGSEGHYVVLYCWAADAVLILDPIGGLRRLARADFEATWSSYLVEYRPTPALRPRPRTLRPARIFLRFARQHTPLLLTALLFGLLATSLGWTFSFFLRALIDQIVPNRDTALLVALGAGLMLLSGTQALLQLGRLWLSARVGRTIHRTYGTRFVDQLMALPMKVFDTRCVSGLVMRINQADAIQQAISEWLLVIVTDVVMFLASLGVMLFYDPVVALIALCAVPLMMLVIVLLNERVYASQLAMTVQFEEFSGQLIETFEGLRTIKTFSAEARYLTMLGDKLDRLIQARYENRTALILPATWGTLATALITACILWYGGARVMAGQLTPGDLIVLFGMVAFYLNPVQRLPGSALMIRGALIGITRLEEILGLPPERARAEQVLALPEVRGQIEFAQVGFEYRPRRPVLKNINLTIAPGETIAIVGETGSGKTSLANLIAGFYLPSRGEVRIDGVSTRRLLPDELRRAISAVFQNARLFQHSVRENMTMLADRPIEEVRRAAAVANAAPFIDDLLRGYETQVSRGGDNFSSGQAQRIALARALLKDAPILILDEATSNLDSATEQAILQALGENRRGRTTVIIAHRLSTVLSADRIVVMDNGEIVEVGTHEELMGRQGRYYALFRWQMIERAQRDGAAAPALT